MVPSLQKFGNTWTQEKLDRVRKYLSAYTKILDGRRLTFAYIDAFAGTGYHELKQDKAEGGAFLFPDAEETEFAAFLQGSARIALGIEPRFNRYIFIEKDARKTAELGKLKSEFPDKAADIRIETGDANKCLQELCAKNKDWSKHRAVLFLDPFGMQVTWNTLEAVAATRAIDTWILFPVSAVNRLIPKDLNIRPAWRKRLDLMFGESAWCDVFTQPLEPSLFEADSDDRMKSPTIMRAIGEYFNQRLKSIFADVADNPLTLRNSRGSPLFLLCFAVANPHAVKPAIKIAQSILSK